jgi:hypothetical protein
MIVRDLPNQTKAKIKKVGNKHKQNVLSKLGKLQNNLDFMEINNPLFFKKCLACFSIESNFTKITYPTYSK